MKTITPYIFLVEDDADDRFRLQQAFENVNFGAQVRMFSSSESFLSCITSIADLNAMPTLFVLDFNMPIINGGELLIRLKRLDKLNEIPVVLYSTGMRPVLKEMLIATGAKDCFEKALGISELLRLAKTLRLLAEGNEIVY